MVLRFSPALRPKTRQKTVIRCLWLTLVDTAISVWLFFCGFCPFSVRQLYKRRLDTGRYGHHCLIGFCVFPPRCPSKTIKTVICWLTLVNTASLMGICGFCPFSVRRLCKRRLYADWHWLIRHLWLVFVGFARSLYEDSVKDGYMLLMTDTRHASQ